MQISVVIIVSLICFQHIIYTKGLPVWDKFEIETKTNNREKRDLLEEIFLELFGIEDSSEEEVLERYLVCSNCTIVLKEKPNDAETHLPTSQVLAVPQPQAVPAAAKPQAVPAQVPAAAKPQAVPAQVPAAAQPQAVPAQVPAAAQPQVVPAQVPAAAQPQVVPAQVPAAAQPQIVPAQVPAAAQPQVVPAQVPAEAQPQVVPAQVPAEVPAVAL